ncbi:hypothetical protein QBC42DRAFT_263838, partial [Cladorrhinum samala]
FFFFFFFFSIGVFGMAIYSHRHKKGFFWDFFLHILSHCFFLFFFLGVARFWFLFLFLFLSIPRFNS